ncbi:MAG: hypothetical protein EOP04_04505 [Proteobacteria bacterium]|nr:MAG: hypothetical protein EOP04_04505 [Pseudomonadota bacterium]
MAILKYLHINKKTAFLNNASMNTVEVPPEFEGFSTFVLNPRPNEGYEVTSWLRFRGLSNRYLNNQEIFVSIPLNSRLENLLIGGKPTHGIWRNPFF